MQYQDLCEVFTDKLVAKIPSTASGKITEINFGDDDIIPVGHVILKIDEGGDGAAAAADASASETDAAVPATTPASPGPSTHVPIQNQVKDKVSTAPPGNDAR